MPLEQHTGRVEPGEDGLIISLKETFNVSVNEEGCVCQRWSQRNSTKARKLGPQGSQQCSGSTSVCHIFMYAHDTYVLCFLCKENLFLYKVKLLKIPYLS